MVNITIRQRIWALLRALLCSIAIGALYSEVLLIGYQILNKRETQVLEVIGSATLDYILQMKEVTGT